MKTFPCTLNIPLLFAFLVLASPLKADPLDQWTRQHPYPSWSGIAFANNRFVIVGEIGAIQTSSDGVTWAPQTSGTGNALADVTYANGRFVAVGNAGTIVTSADGQNWLSVPSGVTTALGGVTYANGTFVAVGASGTVLTSGTGLTWNLQSGISNTLALKSVTFGNNLFVAITSAGEIIESPNGTVWAVQPSVGGTPYHVAFLNNQFVIADYGMKFSADGTNWTANYVYPVQQAVTYLGGYYVSAGTGGSIQYSSNGTTWTAATANNSTYDLSAIACGNGTLVAVGLHGLIRTSTDHLNWPIRNQSLTYLANLYGVKYINNEFMVVGDMGVGPGGVGEDCPILCSGIPGNWYRRPSGSFNTFWDVAYGNGTYVIATATAGLRTSTNGNNWISVGSGLSHQQAGLIYANNLFVLVGWSGGISTSPDGATWTARIPSPTTTRNLWGAVYGNGLFVAVGQTFGSVAGVYVTSSNGVTWTTHNFSSANFRNIAYGANTFVVVGDSGYIATSTTGLSWTPHSSGTSGTLYGVCFGDGYFVAVGAGGYLATSPDGSTWTTRNSGTGLDLERVAFGNGTFVATGLNGTAIGAMFCASVVGLLFSACEDSSSSR